MDKMILVNAGIDYDGGLKRCLNDTSLYERVLCKFPGDKSYSKIVEALESADAKAAFEAAHTLKGVSANLGLTDLYDSVFPLVEELRNEFNYVRAEQITGMLFKLGLITAMEHCVITAENTVTFPTYFSPLL